MIIDLPRFIGKQRPLWNELERFLDRLEKDAGYRPDLKAAMRLHYLYQRTSADLEQIRTFASEPRLSAFLESLVARAYSEIHESRGDSPGFRPGRFFLVEFPRVFQRRFAAFAVAAAVMLAGVLFGGGATALDRQAKSALVPPGFEHLIPDPARRVADEEDEASKSERHARMEATFSGYLMTHNIRVSILLAALGMTFGVGTLILLFYNGVLLGFVVADYVLAGQGVFVAGWLLPHGVIEIPAVLIGGQAGLVLAGALVGRGDSAPLTARLRAAANDFVVLVGGLAALLVWAGIVEAFLSQIHEPAIPYSAKIAFGVAEFALLALFLGRRRAEVP